MVSQRLINYIKEDLKNHDKEEIKNILVGHGYPEELANITIKAAVETNEQEKGDIIKEKKEKENIKTLEEERESRKKQLKAEKERKNKEREIRKEEFRIKRDESKKKFERLKKKTAEKARKNSKVLILILIIMILGASFFVFNDFFNDWFYNIKNERSLILDLNFEDYYLINVNSTVIKDNSKYGNDGTLKRDAKLVDTDFGKAVELNKGGYVEVKDSNSLDISDEITIETLIYTYNASKIQTIMAKGDNPDWYITIFNHSVLSYLREGKDIPNHILLSNTKLEDNVWYVITLTYDGSVMEMYINGKQEEDITFHNRYWDGGIQVNDHNLLIGINERWEREYFGGLIKSVKVYTRALTEGEIKNSYLLLEE